MVALSLEGLALVCEGHPADGMKRLDEAATAALAGEVASQAAVGYCCCYMMRACETVRDSIAPRSGARASKRFAKGCISTRSLPFAGHSTRLCSSGAGHGAKPNGSSRPPLPNSSASRPAMEGEALVHLAALRRHQGRFDEARALLSRSEGHPLVILESACLALDEGDAAAGARLAERFLRQLPPANRSAMLVGQGALLRAQLALGDRDRARSVADDMQRLAAQLATPAARASARLGEGLALAAASEFDSARGALEDSVDLLGRASAVFEQAQARLALARVLAKSRQVPEPHAKRSRLWPCSSDSAPLTRRGAPGHCSTSVAPPTRVRQRRIRTSRGERWRSCDSSPRARRMRKSRPSSSSANSRSNGTWRTFSTSSTCPPVRRQQRTPYATASYDVPPAVCRRQVATVSASTSTGLTRVARRAGAMHASSAMQPVATATVPRSTGSVGWTPKTRPFSARAIAIGPGQAEHQANADQHHALGEHQLQDATHAAPQGHADADLARATGHEAGPAPP